MFDLSKILDKRKEACTFSWDDSQEYRGAPLVFTNNWFKDSLGVLREPLLSLDKGNPLKILEIGVWEGASSFWFLFNLCGHPQSSLVSIDPNPKPQFFSNLSMIPNVYSSKVSLIKNSTPQALTSLRGSYDMAFIDGAHYPLNVFLEIAFISQYIKDGGIIVLDDCSEDHTLYYPPRYHAQYEEQWGLPSILSSLDENPFAKSKGVLNLADTARICAAFLTPLFTYQKISERHVVLKKK